MADQSQATIAEELPTRYAGALGGLAQNYIEACFESLKRRCESATELPFIPEGMDEWLESLSSAGSEVIRNDFDHAMPELGWYGPALRALLFPKEEYDSERIFARRFNLFLREQGVKTRFGTNGTHLRIL